MSFDENPILFEGRALASWYMESRLVPLGISLLANVGWKSKYLHSISDNYSGNKTGIDPAVAYSAAFKGFPGAFMKMIDKNFLCRDSASALWE